MPNTAPVAILSISPNPVGFIGSVRLDASASYDVDNGDSIISYEFDLDYDGLAISPEITGAMPVTNVGVQFQLPLGANTIALQVHDSAGAASGIATGTLTVIDHAPTVANPIPDQSSPEDQPWCFALPLDTFSDVDGNLYFFAATLASGEALPSWLTFHEPIIAVPFSGSGLRNESCDLEFGGFSGTPPHNF